MKNHYHVLHPFSDEPYHHFYCRVHGCWREFWSEEAVAAQTQECYEHGLKQGLEQGFSRGLIFLIRGYIRYKFFKNDKIRT